MPGPLRSTAQRAEAKYNVTTEFPSLGLHSAAATGNVGLVEYALDRGQPVNSVLDGVLPLHAACAGGNVQVVKLLIDHGADVNAPRLPRRYSNDKSRDSSAPIVGTSGSTSLHFAAANGNYEAVNLLLLRGAHADRADKYGVTSEMLARQNGWLECADLLRQWMVNKDRDLRERPGGLDDRVRQAPRTDPAGNDDPHTSSLARRRLHVKQSFDTALSRLKPTSSLPINASSSPPGSPSRLLIDTSDQHLNYSDMDRLDQISASTRRPSLPHIMQSSITLPRSRKTSTPNITGANTPQRPGSSGGPTENTDQESGQGSARGMGPRKLGSKLSLMNLFKKAQGNESGQFSDSSLALPPIAAPNFLNPPSATANGALGNIVAEPTASNTFIPRVTGRDPSNEPIPQLQALGHKASTTPRSPPQPLPVPLAVDLHNAMMQERQVRSQRSASRDRGMSASGASPHDTQDNMALHSAPCPSPLARIFRSKNHKRDRSGSGASSGGYKEEKSFDSTSTGQDEIFDSVQVHSPPKPSILKPHGRSPSNGPVNSSPRSRALRFDSSSTAASNRSNSGYGNAGNRGLRICNSAGSLKRYQSVGPPLDPEDSGDEDFGQEKGSPAPPGVPTHDEYLAGKYASSQGDLANDDDHEIDLRTPAKSPQILLLTRDRGLSFTSASDVSLSPVMSNEEHVNPRIDMFPFSINKPPLLESDDQEHLEANHLQVPDSIETRVRGDSVSSASTTDSQQNPALSMSGTTSGSDTNTLWMSPEESSLPPPDPKSTNGLKKPETNGRNPPITPESKPGSKMASSKRAHIPSEININSISSHAQAEALVQKTQQDIFDIASSNEVTHATSSEGLSPLSARLAAYGESLALERKFREVKGLRTTSNSSRSPQSQAAILPEIITTDDGGILNTEPVSRNGVGRQHSLERRPNRPRVSPRLKAPKRPSTAEGVTARREDHLFFPRESWTRQGHHTSRSASGFSTSPSSRLASFRDVHDTLWGEGLVASPPILDPATSRSLNMASSTPTRPKADPDGQLSRISSLDSPDLSSDFGSVLTSATSTPLGPSRIAKSSVKLAKMGFPANSVQALMTPSKKPFSLRDFVHSLKGKS